MGFIGRPANPGGTCFSYPLEPLDPLSLAAATTLMTISVLVAAYLPARRAGAIDPVNALRQD